MASYTVYRNGTKFYSVELSTSRSDLSDGVSRVSASAHVSFGDWYYYGLRCHVAINGVEVDSTADYTTGSYHTCAYASGSLDVGRANSGWNCWVTAWVTSETVSGYGGVPTEIGRDLCGENVWIPEIPAYQPAAPSGLSIARVSDASHKLSWTNNPDNGARKYYTGINVYRHTNDGGTETLYSGSVVSNYTDSTTKADRKYSYDVRAQWRGGTSDMSNVVVAYTTPAAPSSASVEKLGDRQARLAIGSGGAYATGRQAQATTDGGSTWTDVALEWEKGGAGYTALDSSAPAGTVKYRVRNAIDNPVNGAGDALYSAWVETGTIVTICPPLAPAVSVGGAVFATGATAAVSWVPNHPDGTAQAAARVEITTPGGKDMADVAGASSSYSLTLAESGSYAARVRTKGLDESWGEWSSYVSFKAYEAPAVEITHPSVDGAVVDLLPYAVKWDASDGTGITAQSIALLDSGGSVVASATLGADAREWSVSDIELSNGSEYTVSLSVTAGSGLSVKASRKVVVEWAAPLAPELAISYGDGFMAVAAVSFVQTDVKPVKDGGMVATLADSETIAIGGRASYEGHGLRLSVSVPRTESATIERVYGGESVALESGLSDGQSAIDRLPPLNTAFSYRATAFAATGAAASADFPALIDSGGSMAFNFGQAAERYFCPKLDLEDSGTWERNATGFHFADGGASMLPTFYAIDEFDETRGYTFAVVGEDEWRAYSGETVKEWCGWVRGVHGERKWCMLKWDASHLSHIPWGFSATCSATVGVWREPANG